MAIKNKTGHVMMSCHAMLFFLFFILFYFICFSFLFFMIPKIGKFKMITVTDLKLKQFDFEMQQ